MRINHNVSAKMANVNLKKTDERMKASLERLTSGNKINRAGDDAAGMAITNKMRAQINALDQASRNSLDGQSIIETAEGAMSEVENILQRIRELAVQAANDTYTLDDRAMIQMEVDEMLNEVDRISTTTEFNGKLLLDGSTARTFASSNAEIHTLSVSMEVFRGDYKIDVTELAKPATVSLALPSAGDTFSLNGSSLTLPADASQSDIESLIQGFCDKMNIDTDTTSGLSLTTRATGVRQKIEYTLPNGTTQTVFGTAAKVTLVDGFQNTATVYSEGNLITIRDNDGFEMRVEAGQTGEATLRVFDAGYLTMQIGANEHQTLNMNFPRTSTQNLGLRNQDGINLINLCTQYNAGNAIRLMDQAISQISAARSTLGAYQNRLETTADSLSLSSQNITSAMSRIGDTNMATEMTEYTQRDVLSQAATSMLAQANNRPQQVMALLQ